MTHHPGLICATHLHFLRCWGDRDLRNGRIPLCRIIMTDCEQPLTSQPPVFLLGISGPSSAGKTTLAHLLSRIFAPHVQNILHGDDFCKEISLLPTYNGYPDADGPGGVNCEEMIEVLRHVRANGGKLSKDFSSWQAEVFPDQKEKAFRIFGWCRRISWRRWETRFPSSSRVLLLLHTRSSSWKDFCCIIDAMCGPCSTVDCFWDWIIRKRNVDDCRHLITRLKPKPRRASSGKQKITSRRWCGAITWNSMRISSKTEMSKGALIEKDVQNSKHCDARWNEHGSRVMSTLGGRCCDRHPERHISNQARVSFVNS